MKPRLTCYVILISVFIFSCSTATNVISIESKQSSSTLEKLATIKNIVSIEKKTASSHFNDNYVIWFEQPVDYNDNSKGTFRQRVFLKVLKAFHFPLL